MKIFKSIRWRLQIWYGLILMVVLAGFGFTTYQLEHGKMYRQIDTEVMRRVGILSNALRPAPPRAPHAGEPPFDRPPQGPVPGDGLPGQDFSAPADFHLPPQAAGLFDPGDPNGFYFIIKLRDGSELARSTNAPVGKTVWDGRPSAKNGNTVLRVSVDPFHSPSVFTFGKIREFVITLPSGDAVFVGCSIAPALKEFRLLILKLVAFGGV